MDRVILFAVQLLLATTFLVSGSAKALSSAGMQGALAVTGLGARPIRLLGLTIPLMELAIAIGLLFGSTGSVRVALGLCAIVSLAFSGWVAAVLARDQKVACGCFGTSSRPISRRTLLRNLALTGVAAAATVGSIPIEPIHLQATAESALLLIGAVTVVFFGSAFRLARPALMLSWPDADPYYSSEVS